MFARDASTNVAALTNTHAAARHAPAEGLECGIDSNRGRRFGPMYILGLATMNDSAAVLLEDGRAVAAAEEERFSRRKHEGGVPYRAVESVLASCGLRIGDIDQIAVNWDPFQLGHRARYVLGRA